MTNKRIFLLISISIIVSQLLDEYGELKKERLIRTLKSEGAFRA